MAYVQPTDVVVGDPVEAANQNAQNAALANLNSRTAGIETLVLPNGSMEFDLDSDGEPDNWSITDLGSAGAIHVIDSTASNDGVYSLKCSITSTGGYVEALNDTILPIYEGARIEVGFGYKSSLATARVRVNIRWLTAAGSLVTEVSAFDENTSHPSSFIHLNGYIVTAVAPSTARWFQIKLIAGESGNTVNADVWFDAIIPRIYHGFVPVSIIDSDQPLATYASTTANTDYTMTPATAMSTVFAIERPHAVVVYYDVTSGTGLAVDQINSAGGRILDRNGGSTPELDGGGAPWRVELDRNGSFVWRSEDAGLALDWYLVGYYV